MMLQKNIDKISRSAVACGQVALKPRVTRRNLAETQVFLCPTDERLSGVGVIQYLLAGKIPAVSRDGFKTPGTLESAILEKTRGNTMNTARQASALPDTRKVVSMDKYRPPVTAEQLITEALGQRTGTGGASLEESILMLPETFAYILDLILEDFDYRGNKRAKTAIACRLLAASVNHYEEILQEVA